MSERDFRRGYFGVAMSLLLLLASREVETLGQPLLQGSLVIIALGFSLAGCVVYARAKGLSGGHAFFGLLPLWGFWILLCIKGREGAGAARPGDSEGAQ